MAINLATKFSDKVAERFTLRSLTDAYAGKGYDFSGVKSIKIYSVDSVPVGDYTRSGSTRFGTLTELGDTVQEMTMTQDKGFTFSVDAGNDAEQLNIKQVTKRLRMNWDEQATPLIDKYRFSKWMNGAGLVTSESADLTKANIVDGFVEYIPQKTKMEHANTVRVPLNQKAREILERYKDLENALLPRFSHFGYNKKIKEILKYVGIDRKVIVLDPKTREDVARPLYEVASTHTARKTFIGNLYRQVKDPNLIASMSGHSEGSRAFARYRKIDDEMKKELVNLLD